tara:strand:+ start:3949 stop:5487 length:1539 start_codon:yes stop_codon:yes gene_type:complete
MERVAPPQVNYDNVLPLAIESRSNRREFLPVNGQTFGNANGQTICRIDVNADSMLDASHSYLECVLTNTNATANNHLRINPFSPAWIQRLRIESGGVVIEDINEYSRLYSMLMLNQVPESYVKNNVVNQGMYSPARTGNLMTGAASVDLPEGLQYSTDDGNGVQLSTATGALPTELHYPLTAQGILRGGDTTATGGSPAAGADNQPTATGITHYQKHALAQNGTQTMCIPLVSGFLNMDKYIPLIMLNAGFTIELTLCDPNRIGITDVQAAGANADATALSSVWTVSACKYVAHLIDLDRTFYDRLRVVMESSGGVLQLAGQTYRHFVGSMPNNVGPHTITLPARVKSVKSIFGTFISTDQMGSSTHFDTSVFQSANLSKYRFEIGSVRYPQTDVNAATQENQAELQKAWGKLGDYSHEQPYNMKHTENIQQERNGTTPALSLLSAYFVGYDFEAFQRVALEAGINTADRSLPINFIAERSAATIVATRCDFFILSDAIYYINLDGTISVSV